ncbi:hypothetical protein AB0G71_08865 [Streptomyces sp. NPDC020403]|uniref:hypothetical protein n=1 Tax=unclassified Streptomyces TaxID=2593676 RepID=UPI0033F4E58F
MIDFRRAWARRLRRCRAVLLPVLIVVIAAHITGAGHSAAFTGAHIFIDTACPQTVAAAAHDGPGHRAEPMPAHEHGPDAHGDHAMDRPRPAGASAEPLPVGMEGMPAGPADDATGPGVLSGQRPFRSEGSAPRRHHAELATRCVWRQ